MRRMPLLAITAGILLFAAPAFAEWRAMGLSGRVVHRLQVGDGQLYACTNTGLYRTPLASPDSLWTFLGFAGQGVNDLAVVAPNVLLAAKDLSGSVADSVSIFLSTNGGSTWQPFQNGFGAGGAREARRLQALSGAPSTLLAVGGRTEKSTDGGLSWRIVMQGFAVNALEQSPADPQLLWVGGETLILAPFVRKSTDAGDTWTTMNMPWFGDNAVDAIAGHPVDPLTVYLGMEGRVMTSGDGGATWKTLTSPNPTIYTFGMAARPFLPLRIYAAGASVVPDPLGVVYYTSDDGGESWTTLSYAAAAGYGVSHLLLRMDGGTEVIYLATWNGVYGHRTTSVDVPPTAGAPRIRLGARPNPFRRGTEILFDLPSRQAAVLSVLDVQGRVVATLLEGTLEAGSHRVRWTASARSSGIYVIRLAAGGRTSSVKVLHLP